MAAITDIVKEGLEARKSCRKFYRDNARVVRGLPEEKEDININIHQHTHEHEHTIPEELTPEPTPEPAPELAPKPEPEPIAEEPAKEELKKSSKLKKLIPYIGIPLGIACGTAIPPAINHFTKTEIAAPTIPTEPVVEQPISQPPADTESLFQYIEDRGGHLPPKDAE